MATIKFVNIEKQEVSNTLQEFEKKGWSFNTHFLKDSKLETELKDPHSRIWTVEKIITKLDKKLDFGNEQQVYAYKALNLYNSLYNKFGPAYLGFDPKKTICFKKKKHLFLFQIT